MAAWRLEIIPLQNLMPLILLSSGLWTIGVAGLKVIKPEGNGAFGTFAWGMLFIVLGGSWFLSNTEMLTRDFAVVFVLLLFGALAIVVAIKSSRK